MNEETGGRIVELFAQRRGIEAAGLSRRLRRVLLQRAWKVCGTFARAVVQGRGPAYVGYLPPQLALVRRLLGESPSDQAFGAVLGSRIASVC
jgi:hypothetical protein